MRRPTITRVTAVTAISCVAMAALVAPFTAFAQQNAGGVLMKLRLGERFVQRDTTSPDPQVDGTTTQLVTDLDLSISSETRTQAVTLTFGTGYRFFDGPTSDGVDRDFADPELRLTYTQVAAASSLSTFATATRVDLAETSPLTLSDDPDGGLTRDFSQLTEGGTRTALAFGGTWTWRDDAPFGLGVTLGIDDISYSDLPAGSTLDDSTALSMATTARFEISPVLTANVGLRYSNTDFATTDDVTRTALDANATLAQTNGSFDAQFSTSDGDGGVQNTLRVSRSYTLPNTTARFGLGLSQVADRDVALTGSASLKHDFSPESPFGSFTASASRDEIVDGRSNAETITSLSLGTDYAINPVAKLLLAADLGQAEDLQTGATVDLSEVSLSLRYTLSPDWLATAGVRATNRDPSDLDATTSTTVSLGVSRSFTTRP